LAQETQVPDAGKEKKDKEKAGKEAIVPEDLGWKIRDFKPYLKAFKELEKLNKEYSDNLLKLAMDEYATGLDILEDMENEVAKLRSSNKNKKYLNERWYWQEIDRKNQEQRYIGKKKYEAKMKAVTYFTRSIKYMDEIQNTDVKNSDKFMEFQTRLFQLYVSTQYDLNNYKPCIPILERYIALSQKTKEDPWAYTYLASCYGYMEAVLTKYKHATEDEIMKYRNNKNRYLLEAVKLKYTDKSPHYQHIQEMVEQDEKKSEKINDYK